MEFPSFLQVIATIIGVFIGAFIGIWMQAVKNHREHKKMVQEYMIDKHILRAVLNLRLILQEAYHTDEEGSEHEDYRGLCNYAIYRLKDFLNMEGIEYTIKKHHGELAHRPFIDPNNWTYQHTWCEIDVYCPMISRNVTIYIDPTCEQFRCVSDRIPLYYISMDKPFYVYDDRNNIAFTKVGLWLNNHIQFKWKDKASGFRITMGIVNIFQYVIWAGICKVIRKRKYNKK